MKSFKQFVSEALNQDQDWYIEHYINYDDPRARSVNFSDHLFNKDAPPKDGKVISRDSVIFDMPKVPIHPEFRVSNFLKDIGYSIKDYKQGLALGRGQTRPIGIGKLLSKKFENLELDRIKKSALQTYNTSDVRTLMDAPLEVMITRSPHKVAEMSTNKPRWTSCLSLGTCPSLDLADEEYDVLEDERDPRNKKGYYPPGSRAKFIRDEILSGTHVAYLINQGDYDLKNPVARISLKPYHSEDVKNKIHDIERRRPNWEWKNVAPQHTILRPSAHRYSSVNLETHAQDLLTAFTNRTLQLTKEHFPLKHESYTMDPLSYWDTLDYSIWNKKTDLHYKKPHLFSKELSDGYWFRNR